MYGTAARFGFKFENVEFIPRSEYVLSSDPTQNVAPSRKPWQRLYNHKNVQLRAKVHAGFTIAHNSAIKSG
jgi:hypothetical protein